MLNFADNQHIVEEEKEYPLDGPVVISIQLNQGSLVEESLALQIAIESLHHLLDRPRGMAVLHLLRRRRALRLQTLCF